MKEVIVIKILSILYQLFSRSGQAWIFSSIIIIHLSFYRLFVWKFWVSSFILFTFLTKLYTLLCQFWAIIFLFKFNWFKDWFFNQKNYLSFKVLAKLHKFLLFNFLVIKELRILNSYHIWFLIICAKIIEDSLFYFLII